MSDVITPERFRLKVNQALNVREKSDNDLVDIFNQSVDRHVKAIYWNGAFDDDYLYFNNLQTEDEYRRLKKILENAGWYVKWSWSKKSIRVYHEKPSLWTRIME